MSNNLLQIDLQEEFKIKIDEPNKLEESFFKDIFNRAAQVTADILKLDPKVSKQKSHFFVNQENEYNNIISFCGERGTGKSSAMITYARSLININDAEYIKTVKVNDELKLSDFNFKSLEVIDPSMFEKGENIFEIILAQLFLSFENELKDLDSNKKLNEKRELLEAFEKVYENLQTVRKNGKKYDGEALETLSKLACGANLRNNFKELVNLYLKFISNSERESILVIAIDDFDLNVEAVAEMAEQIRKYLMIPKVVILMAVNIELLNQAKKNDIMDKMPLEYQNDMDTNEYHYIATRFTSKFIPEKNRLYLPNLKFSNNTNLIKINGEVKGIEEFVLEEIYEKTGIILVANRNESPLIVPETIRELKHLLHFLDRLDTIVPLHLNPDENNRRILKSNLSKFNTYLTEYWATVNLSEEYKNLLKELDRIDFSQKNQFVISKVINKYHIDFAKTRKTKANSDIEALYKAVPNSESIGTAFIKVIDKSNNYANISIGDVIKFFKSLISMHNSAEDKLLYLIFKIKYSSYIIDDLIVEKKHRNTICLINGFVNNFETNFIQNETIAVANRNGRSNYRLLSRQHFKINYSLLKTRKYGNQELNKVEIKNVELLHYFINHFGHEEFKRPFESVYSTIFDETVNNIQKAFFDILMPVVSQFYSDEIKVINDADSGTIDMKSWFELGYVSILPIYSIDLLDSILDVNALYYKNFASTISYFEIVKGFYSKLEHRIKDVTEGNVWGNFIVESFTSHPVMKGVNNADDDLKQLINELRVEEKGEAPYILIIKELNNFIKQSLNTKAKTYTGYRRFISKTIKNTLKYSREQFRSHVFMNTLHDMRSGNLLRVLSDVIDEIDSDLIEELTIEFKDEFIEDFQGIETDYDIAESPVELNDESKIYDLIDYLTELKELEIEFESDDRSLIENLEIEISQALLRGLASKLIVK
ncbi:hypothetical protein DF185_13240 [Marinifilum breve]|uniref:KAP NTPase domain-containing protein n=1 Tax=Marinifilum breve TaxID=2184082 RepID=A0A2V3ZZ78_9BACT|nr:hypothetical protein [Marinifilum breve]PXY00857.1 hypothetical protein DF185_13240 [Marinifilum breve]